jgi:2-oxoglutarate dehydrogenase E1 component
MSRADSPAAPSSSNLPFAEDLYAQYQRDPASVPADWQAWFADLDRAPASNWDVPPMLLPVPGVPAGPVRAPEKLDPDTLRRRVALLHGYPLFEGLAEAELAELAAIAAEVTFADGEFLYHDGDMGDSLFLVQSGELTVIRGGSVLVDLTAGQVTGELCLLYSQPRSADVQAKGAATALRLRRGDFEHLLDTRGHLARVVMQNFTRKLSEINARQERVDMLIRGYRVRGHVIAQLDPLSTRPQRHPELELAYYGLTEADLDSAFSCRTLHGAPVLTLRQIIQRLRNTYCGPIGVQYMHIDDPDMKDWLQVRMETSENRCELGRDEQIRIFTKLTDAEVFEAFLQKKFVGAKRFSLEGGESLIPLLDLAIEEASARGVDEVVIGMAHRGRLNVLANILGKSPQQIFREFEDADAADKIGRGDVKYHLGHSSVRLGANGRKQKLQLCFNPSHLEFVGPVAVGRVRARQDRLGDAERRRVMPIVIHGDAAFAGQGVVQETLNLGNLPGYSVGGTIHIIVNNQIGFTTPPESSRSSPYATDIAKMLQVPIFHVNGEHPEGVAQVIKLAMEFREHFQQDVIVDMYCYRRHGHNEGDDPTFTQPLMYQAIRARKSVVEGYLDALLSDQTHAGMTREEAREIAMRSQLRLEEELSRARTEKPVAPPVASGSPWAHYCGGKDRLVPEVETTLAPQRLTDLLAMQCKVPEGFTPHPKIARLLQNRLEMAEGRKSLDWGAGEALAFASIAVEGRRLRLSGQDSGRGTFSHRHAVLHDYQTGEQFLPLQHLSPEQGPVEIIDSSLSEAGVLGFDYGYSLDQPDGLTIWEAQFGDFSNCAQVIIDQFISSSEDKWQRLSGITMLLPHGFEGQGPEHSSARLERYLNISAEDNIQVVNLTTPAQLFHCLRRQVLRPIRKPLVVMSPKSLLRHPEAVSALTDFATGGFQRVIPDASVAAEKVTRVLLCSGKVYFDLVQARRDRQREDVAILRLEQLYPLSDLELEAALQPYAVGTPVFWVQEEPRNMGAWVFLRMRLGKRLFGRWTLHGVTRPESASPATGSNGAHKLEQARLMEQAFGSAEAEALADYPPEHNGMAPTAAG